VQEAFPFSISIRWKSTDAGGTKECSSIVFQKGISVPITKVLTFYRQGSFGFDVLYTDMRDHPPDTSQKISTYVVRNTLTCLLILTLGKTFPLFLGQLYIDIYYFLFMGLI
jgi:hypothetical protein